MGDILGTPASASPTPRVRRERPRDKSKLSRPYAAVQKPLQPAKPLKLSSYIRNGPTTLAERNSDLRAVFSRNSMKLKRWYRDGEVVWCELRPKIPGPAGENGSIEFWPGLVQEYKPKSQAIPRTANVSLSDSNQNSSQPIAGPSTNGFSSEEGRGPMIEKENHGPFQVVQSTIYLVELFAVNKSIHLSDNQVIPYQAYIPSDDLICSLQSVTPEHLNFDRDSVAKFNPCPGDNPPPFHEAAGPYAVALQIASNASQFFSVTDEWDFTYTIPVPPAPPLPSQPTSQANNLLTEAITAAGRMNYASMAMANTSLQNYTNLSGSQPTMSQMELDRLKQHILGSQSSSSLGPYTQIRFQGLWWGPERIWVDDFVRLKVHRRSLAPHGAQDISPPAGPSKSAREAYKLTGRDVSEIGAGTRGVFMRVDSLFAVESVSEGRRRKECRVGGPLFELVDEDWDEKEDEVVKQHQTSSVLATSSTTPDTTTNGNISTSNSTNTNTGTTTTDPVKAPPTELPAAYLPPQPPIGYKFRPILSPGHEAVVSLSLLSGRYYPGLLMHPLLSRELQRAAQVPLDEGGILKFGHIWALDGLNGGFHCSVDPDTFQSSRTKMLEKADREAYIQLQQHKQFMAEENGEAESEGSGDVDMLKEEEYPTATPTKQVTGHGGDGGGVDSDIEMY